MSTHSSSCVSSPSTDEMPFAFPNSFNSSMQVFRDNKSCIRCGTAMSASNVLTLSFGSDDVSADTMVKARVLDSINALRSFLIDLSHKGPLAKIFCDDVEIEIEADGTTLRERVVGLAAAAKTFEAGSSSYF